MEEHPGVRAAVVAAVGQAAGDKRLVAYVVPEHDPSPTAGALSRFLKQKLPDYMVPSGYVTLDHLPLTANGKVDRQTLPEPATPSAGPFEYSTAERADLTTRIVRLAADVLKVHHIDPEANLLSLGATSIDMIRIANLLDRELSFRPSIDGFYRDPSITGLVSLYEATHEQTGKTEAVPPSADVGHFPLLQDPEEREAFKRRQPGLRRRKEGQAVYTLSSTKIGEVERREYLKRRSRRDFLLSPIPMSRFGEFLSCLRQRTIGSRPKYRYGSAGGLYPVQTYWYFKAGRVAGLPEGIYYYHPVEHQMIALAPDASLDRESYDHLINRPIFDRAAFALFLVARMSAMVPMYGERGLHYATIEAGAMTQLLETIAPDYGLGLCQVGAIDFQRMRHLFALEEGDLLIHSLLGGAIAETESDDNGDNGGESREMKLLEQVKRLSMEEVRTLLAANQKEKDSGE